MALENDYIKIILDRFRDESVKFVVDKYTSTKWYVGITPNQTALSNEYEWAVFEISNSGTNIDINQAGDGFFNRWDDRFILGYTVLSDIILDKTTIDTNIVGEVVANISTLGGESPVTFAIASQSIAGALSITGSQLILAQSVNQGDVISVDISATDAGGKQITKTFSITTNFFASLKSIHCNGVDQKITFTPMPNVESVVDNISYSFWVKIPTGGAYKTLVTLLYGGGGYQQLFQLDGSGSKIYAQIFGDVGVHKFITNKAINDNLWHHVAVAYSQSLSKLDVYIDGIIDLGTAYPVANTTIKTYTGSTLYCLSNVDGNIDDIAIFHSYISSSDVTRIYNNGKPSDLSAEPNLVFYSLLGDKISGTTQLSEVGNNGTLVNLDATTISTDVP